MRILIVGGGGREHALAYKIRQSPLCTELHVAPGNGGIATIATCHAVGAEDMEGQVALAKKLQADFVIVAPDGPLVLGLADALRDAGIKTFGPSKAAAQIEGSKDFTKQLCKKYSIPTAAYETFSDAAAAKDYLKTRKAPYVIKADGLAFGKGVTIAATLEEAEQAVDDALVHNKFGSAGAQIVIEDFLVGEELSFFALCDGTRALPMIAAQDHKHVGEGDTGLMTGGMGAYSPVPIANREVQQRIMKQIVEPSVAGLKQDGAPFSGILFAGLMMVETPDGLQPKLIEFNCRSGDPETQVMMMLLQSDLLPALIAAAEGDLSKTELTFSHDAAITVVMASKGYPGDYVKGTEIKGLDEAAALDGVQIFHAGTKRGDTGEWLSYGGRVLNVTATAPTLKQAQQKAYEAIAKIDWPQGFYRGDIGYKGVRHEV